MEFEIREIIDKVNEEKEVALSTQLYLKAIIPKVEIQIRRIKSRVGDQFKTSVNHNLEGGRSIGERCTT